MGGVRSKECIEVKGGGREVEKRVSKMLGRVGGGGKGRKSGIVQYQHILGGRVVEGACNKP